MDKIEEMVRKEAKAFIKKLPYAWGWRILQDYIDSSDASLGIAVDRMIDKVRDRLKAGDIDSTAMPRSYSDPDAGMPPDGEVDSLNRRSHP